MWNDPNEIRVAANGQIYIADVGTTLPIDFSALGASWVGLGLCNEDGVALSVTPEIFEVKSWQARQATRRDLVAQEIQTAFTLQQWNEENVPFAFGGGSISNPSAGVYRYDFPSSSDALDEKAMVVDAVDGDVRQRYVFARGNVTEAVETQLQKAAASELPIAWKALEPDNGVAAYILFDDDNFTAGS